MASGFGQADVFAGEDDEAAEDEAWVFAGVDHAGQPIEGGVGVGAAHALDEGADGVEVGVAFFIVEDGALLDGLFSGGEVDEDFAGFIFGRCGGGELESIEQPAGVAAGDGDEVFEGRRRRRELGVDRGRVRRR